MYSGEKSIVADSLQFGSHLAQWIFQQRKHLKVYGKQPATSLILIDVFFRKHVVIHTNSEPRVFYTEEKSLWLGEENFNDQLVLDFQLQNRPKQKFEANSAF